MRQDGAPAQRDSGGSAPTGRVLARRLRLALMVQVGERAVLLLVADALLLGQGVFAALLGGGEARDFYQATALLPVLLLVPPALSDLVALEKRSGTLDLSLSLVSRQSLFLTRAGVIAALAWLQSGAVMGVVWWSEPEAVPLAAVLLHLAAVSGLLAAAALFASLHVGSAGGAWLATLVILALLAPWSLFNPVPPRLSNAVGAWAWVASGGPAAAAVLAGASLLLIAYALRRLRRPEVLLR